MQQHLAEPSGAGPLPRVALGQPAKTKAEQGAWSTPGASFFSTPQGPTTSFAPDSGSTGHGMAVQVRGPGEKLGGAPWEPWALGSFPFDHAQILPGAFLGAPAHCQLGGKSVTSAMSFLPLTMVGLAHAGETLHCHPRRLGPWHFLPQKRTSCQPLAARCTWGHSTTGGATPSYQVRHRAVAGLW